MTCDVYLPWHPYLPISFPSFPLLHPSPTSITLSVQVLIISPMNHGNCPNWSPDNSLHQCILHIGCWKTLPITHLQTRHPKFRTLPRLPSPTEYCPPALACHCPLTRWFLLQLQGSCFHAWTHQPGELSRFISQNSKPCYICNFSNSASQT